MTPVHRALTRRRFLTTTPLGALAAPLVARASALGVGGRAAPGRRITLGFIGVGWKGFEGCWGSLLQSFIHEDGVQVLAVCDVDRRYRGRAKAYVDDFYGNQDCAAETDFREVLARPDMDAVVIATIRSPRTIAGGAGRASPARTCIATSS